MNGHRVRAVAALLCDDVRREVSGKEILIGVLTDNVYVAGIPANLIVTLYIRVMFARNEPSNIKFKVLAPSGIQITPEVSFQFPGPPDTESVTSIVVSGMNFQVQMEGRYEFQWQPPEQEWETVASLRIRKGVFPPLGVSQTPVSIGGQPQPEQSQSGAPGSSSPP
jgi:hypothetical protein